MASGAGNTSYQADLSEKISSSSAGQMTQYGSPKEINVAAPSSKSQMIWALAGTLIFLIYMKKR